MKNSVLLNRKKIIIFILLIIGIILVSPIIGKEVYGKTGKLPVQLPKGLFKGTISDEVFKTLQQSESIFTKTTPYKQNEAYRKAKGEGVVLPPIQESTTFWTTQGTKDQTFEDKKNFQENKEIKKDGGDRTLNPDRSNGFVRPYSVSDLHTFRDANCANRVVRAFQKVDLSTTLGIPADGELVSRLQYFINKRNEYIASNYKYSTEISGSSLKYLDDFGYTRYPTQYPVSKQTMLDKYGYTYTSTAIPSYPYILTNILKGNEGSILNKLIVPLNSSQTQQNLITLPTKPNSEDIMTPFSGYNLVTSITEQIYYEVTNEALKRELGNFVDDDEELNTELNNVRHSVADTVKKPRTFAFYNRSKSDVLLSPQAAFAMANQSETTYPSDAQLVLWMTKDGKFQAFPNERIVNFLIEDNVDDANGLALKAISEAFELYYNRLKEWKAKTKYYTKVLGGNRMSNADGTQELYYANGDSDYQPRFEKTEKKSIFNGKSEKYPTTGSWLVGPYKVDYLLNNVSYTDKRNKEILKYFAGMTNMSVFGTYVNKTTNKEEVKEITKWSYFVPLQKEGNKIATSETQVGLKNTHLKYGVPEPNQEFYFEIPYDENLLGISEVKTKFNYTDYDIKGQYYVGAGEYIDFSLDIAVEKLEDISKQYRDVNKPSFTSTRAPNEDRYLVRMVFDKDVYLRPNGATNPYATDEFVSLNWKYENSNNKKVITAYVPYSMRASNINKYGFFYTYEGNKDVNNTVTGGIPSSISFSKGYLGDLRIAGAERLRSVSPISTPNGDKVKVTAQYLFKPTGSSSGWNKEWECDKIENEYSVEFRTIGGQKFYVTIPPVDPLPGTVIVKNNINSVIENGRQNLYSRVIIGHDGSDYTGGLTPSVSYILHKAPDVLIVPKAKLIRRSTQNQVTVSGKLVQKEVEVTLKEKVSTTLKEPDFVLPIGGKVWEDRPYGDKLATYNFILQKDNLDNKDVLLEGITVHVNRLIIRNSDKVIIEKQGARVYKKDNYTTPIGRDEIKTDKSGEWGKYYLRDLGFTISERNKGYTAATHIVKFEFEFKYNGIKYTPVPPLASLKYDVANYTYLTEKDAIKDSVAVENVLERQRFNANIGEIVGDKAIDTSLNTQGKSIGVAGGIGADLALQYKGKEVSGRTESKLDENLDFPITASTLNTGLMYPLGEIFAIDSSQADKKYDLVMVMENDKADKFRNNPNIDIRAAIDNKSIVVFHEANTQMENINLGLLKRQEVDLELESDLMLTVQFVNKKALVNTFANKYDLKVDPNDGYNYLINKYGKEYDDIQYKLDVYKADYIYKTAMYQDPDLKAALDNEAERLKKDNKDDSGRELDIYLQYKQAVTNRSAADNVILSGLNMYYDKSLTPVLTPVVKEIDQEEVQNSQVTGKVSIAGKNVTIGTSEFRIVKQDVPFSGKFDDVKADNEYTDIPLKGAYKWSSPTTVEGVNMITSKNNTNNIIVPSHRRFEVITNFKIDNDMLYKEGGTTLSNAIRLGNKHHLTEIAGYATYNKYSGIITGKIDRDSAPANVNLRLLGFTGDLINGNTPQNFKFLEDDTAVAPVIGVELEKSAPRTVSGLVWEDKRNQQTARVNMGDGIFNASQGEKGIPNKIISLEERVSVKAGDLSPEYKQKHGYSNKILKDSEHYVNIPYIWPDKITGNGISINSMKTLTGFQSYLRTGTDGKYKFIGVPAGNFVAQLPYITVGDSHTEVLGILGKDKIETTKIVDVANRNKSPQVYNGQDFKVSIYNGGTGNVNETWLPTEPKANYSYGRDSEYERFKQYDYSKQINGKTGNALTILNTKHESFDDNTRKIIESTANMTAETPLINFGIEHYSNIKKSPDFYQRFDGIFGIPGVTKTKDGTGNVTKPSASREINNVNIALEERPKTKLVLDKQISRLTLKNSDGTKIVDAKYNTTYDYENIVIPAADKKVLESEAADKKYDIKRQTNNGYSTPEYVLKVKTEVAKESLEGDRVVPLNTNIYATSKPYWEDVKAANNSYTNARGWENINTTSTATRSSNGYIHLNFDKQLLSDTNIEIEYRVQLYNLGEVDRSTIQDAHKNKTLKEAEFDERVSKYVGVFAKGTDKISKLNHEIDKDKYGFGRFFGTGYYTGNFTKDRNIGTYVIYKDKVSKSGANKIIDYVDTSAVKDDLQNDVWTQIKDPAELKDLVVAYDNTGKATFELTKDNLVDPDGKSYFVTGGSNIYVTDKMNTKLIPYYEFATAKARGVKETEIDPCAIGTTIAIKRLSSQQADEDLSFDNLVEIIEYSTESGRRSPSSTSGNVNTRISETFDGKELEPDTGLALLVTITPPTGLSKASRTTFSALNIILVTMVGIGVLAITIKVILDKKSKSDILPNELSNE